MTRRDVVVPTPDGECPASLYLPSTQAPAVILYPDAGGRREAMEQMAARLAGLGYVVLLPDVFYRLGGYEPFDMRTAFSDPDERARLMGTARSLTAKMIVSDAGAFCDFLVAQPETTGEAVGTTGYCMGGRASLIVAGSLPERVAAAASFHGGNLANAEDPDSPHRLADRITAAVHVAAAQDDRSFPQEQADLLEQVFTEAGVRHTLETYSAAHGFAVPDTPAHDADADERHWAATAEFFGTYLPH